MANVFSQVPIKDWYRSKIVLFCLSALFVFAGLFLSQEGVTDTQLQVIQSAYPDIAVAIDEYKQNNNLFALLGAITSAVVAILRVWFTKAVIPQSL